MRCPSACFSNILEFCAVSPPNFEHLTRCCSSLNVVLCLILSTLILGLSWKINLAQLLSSSVALPAQLVFLSFSTLIFYQVYSVSPEHRESSHLFPGYRTITNYTSCVQGATWYLHRHFSFIGSSWWPLQPHIVHLIQNISWHKLIFVQLCITHSMDTLAMFVSFKVLHRTSEYT